MLLVRDGRGLAPTPIRVDDWPASDQSDSPALSVVELHRSGQTRLLPPLWEGASSLQPLSDRASLWVLEWGLCRPNVQKAVAS